MRFLDRLPFLPKHQGKRELVFVVVISAAIMIAGFIAADLGWLYKDVPSSTPTVTVTVATPAAQSTPSATPTVE